jgi:hypothetical protein
MKKIHNNILSEKDFYKKFIAIHIDIKTNGKSKDDILRNGFFKGFNVNAMPFYKSYDALNKLYNNRYTPKTGNFVWLLPKEGVFEGPNGYMTVRGYVPDKHDGFYIVDDNKSTYENYLAQFIF